MPLKDRIADVQGLFNTAAIVCLQGRLGLVASNTGLLKPDSSAATGTGGVAPGVGAEGSHGNAAVNGPSATEPSERKDVQVLFRKLMAAHQSHHCFSSTVGSPVHYGPTRIAVLTLT
jgi:hypothetical protein